ncbi:MAG TPA: thioesterase II family protein [Ktedonobacteraceae bacterium]|jgi:medium-chain acyl-[acyl-carrier-protein] hydrolase|nr:thioesterase II family protein [Ktedonobacteraceae bacterium]
MSENLWFYIRKPKQYAQIRLFCFPYAGGSASIYQSWVDALPDFIEVCAVQLPGRERRLLEPLPATLSDLIFHLSNEIQPFLNKPFALFGHSMGALIAFELAHTLQDRENRTPTDIFVSGYRAPHLPRKEPLWSTFPDPQLLQHIRSLGGVPQEILEHSELVEFLLPLIRSDFRIVESYTWKPSGPLKCPLTAFGGLQDREISVHDILAWKKHTRENFSYHMFPGGHFFIHHARNELLKRIVQQLNSTVSWNLKD